MALMHAQNAPQRTEIPSFYACLRISHPLREANQAKTDREKARTLAAMATDIIFEYRVQTDELHFTGNKLLDLPVTITQFSKKLTSSDALCPDSVGKLQSLLSARFQPGKVETEEINIRSLDGAVSPLVQHLRLHDYGRLFQCNYRQTRRYNRKKTRNRGAY